SATTGSGESIMARPGHIGNANSLRRLRVRIRITRAGRIRYVVSGRGRTLRRMDHHPPANPELALLIRLFDEAYSRKAWHGPNLRGSIRGVTAKEASWR